MNECQKKNCFAKKECIQVGEAFKRSLRREHIDQTYDLHKYNEHKKKLALGLYMYFASAVPPKKRDSGNPDKH